MDREAWCAVIHGVIKSRTWLSDWTELPDIFEHLKFHPLTNQWKVTCSNISSMYLNSFTPSISVTQLAENIVFSYPLLLHVFTACPSFLKNGITLPFFSRDGIPYWLKWEWALMCYSPYDCGGFLAPSEPQLLHYRMRIIILTLYHCYTDKPLSITAGTYTKLLLQLCLQ